MDFVPIMLNVSDVRVVVFGGGEAAFKKVRNLSVSFQFEKSKKNNFTDIEIKKHSKVPSIGAYDITKADKIISKGTKKSYK